MKEPGNFMLSSVQNVNIYFKLCFTQSSLLLLRHLCQGICKATISQNVPAMGQKQIDLKPGLHFLNQATIIPEIVYNAYFYLGPSK